MSWAEALHYHITVLLSIVEYKWVPMNCWRDLVKCREVTWHAVASYLGDQRYSFTFRATKIEVDRILWCGKLGTWANFTILDIISITNGTAKRKSEKKRRFKITCCYLWDFLLSCFYLQDWWRDKVCQESHRQGRWERAFVQRIPGTGYRIQPAGQRRCMGFVIKFVTSSLNLPICAEKHSQLMKICFRNFSACLLSVRQ